MSTSRTATATIPASLPTTSPRCPSPVSTSKTAPQRNWSIPTSAAAKITAIKQRNPTVFINARVDTYWLNQQANPAITIERALRYIDAGADGIFVPLANDHNDLTEIVAAIPRPVNTLPVEGLSLAQLGEIGVARVSTGSMPYSAGLYAAVAAAQAVRDGQLLPPSTPYPDLQARLIEYEKIAGTA